MVERILIVAPSWVGDAILSEPLLALLREPLEPPIVDVLAPTWCAPVYARMRGVRSIVDNPIGHGELKLAARRALARSLRANGYTRAYVLPNSFKSALIPWLARIPRRIGYIGEARGLLLTDARRLNARAIPRMVDRFVALAAAPDELPPISPIPVLVPDATHAAEAMRTLGLATRRPIVAFCPGAEFGPAKRWPTEHFVSLARRFIDSGYTVWLIGSEKDRVAADPIAEAVPDARNACGRTDLGTAIDLLAQANVVVSNDSGLMHAAAAVGRPLVALFGSSSPAFTPPLSPLARVARIDIECSPCFQRECPLGHFKCMRELSPNVVYDLARAIR
ncbi:MAG TPA: lipopolysaccharide heptosyltransferase II [Casimicrobiaceae bacterium]|nr:lipopolysaccharide heptosyltransferase II [Casimicrobiaceae bacterium]